MLFFRPMYLQGLIFAVADAIFETEVSATCFSLNLQMLFSLPVMYNCIYILSFLGFKDTSFANLASTSHVFDNVKMLPSKIPHPQPVLSIPCRYSPVKMCILNLLFQCFEDAPIKILHLQSPKIHYRRYRRSISFEFYLLLHPVGNTNCIWQSPLVTTFDAVEPISIPT